ncbi:hypothetical protein RhiLY_04907 [Ceratobasidium sp. AG-Ba]|nr:hypothetical protein RhiLY_04907 [Ceratobasidium sp. AG-Ba]
MVHLEARDKEILRPYAIRYGKICNGPKRDEHRRTIRSKACDVMLERFRRTKRIKLTTSYEHDIQSLFEVTYRFIDNHRDYDRTHRYQRRFKTHPNVTRRVTRSQTAIEDTEMGNKVEDLAGNTGRNNQGHPDTGSEERDMDGEEGGSEEEGTNEGDANELKGDADKVEYPVDEDVYVDVEGLDDGDGTVGGKRRGEHEGSKAVELSARPESSKSARESVNGPSMLEVELPVSKVRYAQMVKGLCVDKNGRVKIDILHPTGR